MVSSLFLCQNLTMEDILHTILNPYVSVSEKDILWEIMRLEEEDELSANAELRELSTSLWQNCRISDKKKGRSIKTALLFYKYTIFSFFLCGISAFK